MFLQLGLLQPDNVDLLAVDRCNEVFFQHCPEAIYIPRPYCSFDVSSQCKITGILYSKSIHAGLYPGSRC